MFKAFLRVLFSCILSLFLAILGLGVALCHYGQTTVCNPDLLQQVAIDNGYSQQLYEEIVYDWENYLAITGVETPEDIMVVLTQEQVQQDALRYLVDAYTGKATVDTATLRNDLEAKVREYAYSHNIYETPEDELSENINDLVDACIDDYRSAISVPMLNKILGTVNRFGTVLSTCTIALAFGCVFLLLFLFFLQKKRQDTLYYTAISSATGSIILLAIPAVAAYYDVVNRLPFMDSALKSLVRGYLQAIIGKIDQYGKIFLIATIAALALYIVTTIVLAIISTRKPTAKVETDLQEDLK